MVSTAQPLEIEANQAGTRLDHLHAFFEACRAARMVRMARILGADLARLRDEAGIAATTLVSEQQDILGVQWDSLQHEARLADALRATLAAIRSEVSTMLAGLVAFALSSASAVSGARRNTCTLARRASEAARTKLHGLHHVALLSARNAREVLAVG